MGLLDVLFREKSPTNEVSDYARVQSNGGGRKWGDADPATRSIMIGTRLPIKTISAAYTVSDYDTGAVLIVNAAATITLPACTVARTGMHVTVVVGGAGAVTIQATSGELVAFNDLAANSIAFSTSSEIIGNAVHFVCDGTKWYALVHLAAETATPTIAT